MTPFRVKFKTLACVDEAQFLRNIEHAKRYPRPVRGEHDHPVAVCGGGPSLADHLHELRHWPGDIWAINHTADWLLDRGIDCTLFAVDPLIKSSTAAKRLLAASCDPELFTAQAECFDLIETDPEGVPGGSTAAGRTPGLALRLGYPGVVFYGCESSFKDRDHVDRDEALKEALIVRANGRDFKTYPEFMMQAETLSDVIRLAPEVFVSKSGGLLDAMVADQEWEVVAVSDAMKASLIAMNGDCGLYDAPYKPICPECGQTEGHYDDCPVGLGVIA